ncbi:MAG: hypothetical protein JF563_04205 [Acidobacteriales bacterium]|jgi:hypothetical protein|nr:hypothetical protein [Terriglobales bacterium]
MTTALEMLALLLPADDREVVLGDLEEQGAPGWIRHFAVLNFVIRQQAEFWRNWRTWAVGGAVIPLTLLLLGASFRLSVEFRNLFHGASLRESLLYQAALMIGWAWTTGFVIGLLSRRTGWVSPLLFAIPCLSCLMEFREPSLYSPCLLLFLPPGIVGAILGRRWMRMDLVPSVLLVFATTTLMLLWHGMPVLHWLFVLPALYLAWTSGGPNQFKRGYFHDRA